jgi:hypothetical protein
MDREDGDTMRPRDNRKVQIAQFAAAVVAAATQRPGFRTQAAAGVPDAPTYVCPTPGCENTWHRLDVAELVPACPRHLTQYVPLDPAPEGPHTYETDDAPGVYPMRGGLPGRDVVGVNRRRLIVHASPDGLYIGGCLVDDPISVMYLADVMRDLAGRAQVRGSWE